MSKAYSEEEIKLIAPGIISTSNGEYSPTYDSSRDELYFMRRTPGEFDYTIYKAVFSEKGWSEPVIASFSGDYRDAAPYLSPDGNTMYFDSRRPSDQVAVNSINIWYVNRSENIWDEAQLIVNPSVNVVDEPYVGQNEYGPAVDGAGNLILYSFRRPFRGGARYISFPPDYESIEIESHLPDPSAQTFVSYLYISPDGNLALMEGQARGRSDTDLFCSCKKADGSWTKPKEILQVNTIANEGGPALSTDGQFLLFTSNRPIDINSVSNANLYLVRSEKLLIDCINQSHE